MRVLRHQPDHPPQAETRAQSIDQMRELGVLIQRRKAGLRWVETLGHQGREPQHIETEPGIAGIAQHGEAISEQTAHALGIAHRRTGAEFDAMHVAVGAEQRDLQKPRPLPAPLQQPIEIARKLLDGAEHVGFKRDRIGKAALHQRGRDRQTRLDRLVLAAERLVDAADELDPETGGERRARTLQHIADVLETDLRQRIDDLGRKSQARRAAAARALRASRPAAPDVFQLRRNAPPRRHSRTYRRPRPESQNLARRAA